MEYRAIGASDLTSSVLGMGGLHFGTYCDESQTSRLIGEALDLGVTFIDTAPLYGQGRSEKFIGEALRGRRHSVLISTKAGLKQAPTAEGAFGVEVERLTPEYLRNSVECSLINLDTDYIDLLQLHAFDGETPHEEIFQTLEKLKREGKIRYYGCSNYNPEELAVAVRSPQGSMVSSQIQYNMIERRAEAELIPACARAKLGILCNRPLARGLLSGKYRTDVEPPAESRAALSSRIRKLLTGETLELIADLVKFADSIERSMVEIALAWLASAPHITVVLAGVRDVHQLRECVQGVECSLTASQRNQIDGIIAKHGLKDVIETSPMTFFEK